jgi:ABC-type transport system substrate-binding protein
MVLGCLVLTVWVADDPPAAQAQGAGKQPPKRTEDEDDAPPKNPKVQRTEDEDPKTKPGQARPSDVPEIDLLLASRQATHPAVRKMFRELAVPHDVVHYQGFKGVVNQGQERDEDVEPIPQYIPDVKAHRGTLTVTPLSNDGKPLKPYNPNISNIKNIEPYEHLVLEAAKDFLGRHYERLPSVSPDYLTRRDQLVAAEQALGWAVRFHESARQRGQRKGEAWEPLEKDLRQYLLDVRIEQLNALADAKDFDRAFALTRRLAAAYTSPEEQGQIAKPLTELLKKALDSETFSDAQIRAARQRLRKLAEQFPGSKAIKPITDSLREQAEALLDEAQRKGKDPATRARALDLLKQAEETWPQLPGLRGFRMDMAQTYPILRVGLRGDLPRFLSPSRACTDNELRAVELLFESLVKLTPDESGVVRYHTGLAEGRPAVVALGRRFSLPRGALWSNGRDLTANDVRFTVRHLLGKVQVQGRPDVPPEPRVGVWLGLLEAPVVGNDPYQVTLSLRQGYLDPLGLMTFKVLPDGAPAPVDSEAFAQKPVGSGPFEYKGTKPDDQGREYTGFLANANYGSRPSKLGLPRIQEVRFYRTEDPVKDLDGGVIDLALDLTAQQAEALKKKGPEVTVSVPPRPVPNRRVYFLAVNLRRPALASVELRRALAHAINREKLLDDHFRGSLDPKPHRALNGPYPAHSWACSDSPGLKGRAPDGSLDLFDPEKARAFVRQPGAVKALGPAPLTLKYPDGDPALDKAMADLRDQVKAATEGRIDLQLVKRDLRTLKVDVDETQSFDLAYTYYDFPTETYSLWPLLGTDRPGGSNVFGFTNPDVETILQDLRGHRHFADVQQRARELHEILVKEMPMIPLWQLDPLVAWHRTVKPVGLDPLLVFPEIDEWRLDPRK